MEPLQQGVVVEIELYREYNLLNMLGRAVTSGLDVHDFGHMDNVHNSEFDHGLSKAYVLGIDRIREALGDRHPRTTLDSLQDNPSVLLGRLKALNDPDILTAMPLATRQDRGLSRSLNFLKIDFFDAVAALELAVETRALTLRARSCTPDVESASLINDIDTHRQAIRDKLRSGDITSPTVLEGVERRLSPAVDQIEAFVQDIVSRVVAEQISHLASEAAEVDESDRLVVSLQSVIEQLRRSPAGQFLQEAINGRRTPAPLGAAAGLSEEALRVNASIERIFSPPLPEIEDELVDFRTAAPREVRVEEHLLDGLEIDFSDIGHKEPLEVLVEEQASDGSTSGESLSGSLSSSQESLLGHTDL